MIDVTPNIPEVVAEVRELFERYEQALADKDVEADVGAVSRPRLEGDRRARVHDERDPCDERPLAWHDALTRRCLDQEERRG